MLELSEQTRPNATETVTMRRGMVVVAGPDGTGKSTIVEQLVQRAQADGVEITVRHWNPGVFVARGSGGVPVTDPHARAPRGLLGSALKTLLVFADFAVGSATTWRRARRRGLLVVERGWWDQVIDPKRYRLDARVVPLVRALGRLLPEPDRYVLLGGDGEVIADRKHEISADDVQRQIGRWRAVPMRAAQRIELDTVERTADECAAAVVGGPPQTGRWRRPLAPGRLQLQVSDGPSAAAALGVYRPSNTTAKVALASSRRVVRWLPSATPEVPGVESLLASIGLRADTLASFRSPAPDRHVVGAAVDGRLRYVIKLGLGDVPALRNEADFLRRLDGGTDAFGTPTLAWAGEWEGRFAVVMPALDGEPTQPVDVEVARAVADELTVRGLVHGDLASWNLWNGGRPVVIDWEAAEERRAPLHDLAHFVLQDAAVLGRWTTVQAADLLSGEGGPGWRHLEHVGVEPSSARSLLREYAASSGPHVLAPGRYRSELLAWLA